jgi:hypothetical protein
MSSPAAEEVDSPQAVGMSKVVSSESVQYLLRIVL